MQARANAPVVRSSRLRHDPYGIVLKLVVSRGEQVTISVELLQAGSRRSRRAHKPRLLATLRIQAHGGSNTVTIKRIGGNRLVKGHYRLSITTAGAARGTPARVLSLTIGH